MLKTIFVNTPKFGYMGLNYGTTVVAEVNGDTAEFRYNGKDWVIEDFELIETDESPSSTTDSSPKKIKSDGGSSSYYNIPIPEWLAEKLIRRHDDGNCYIKTEEIIRIRYDNDFDFGNADKSLHRAFQATKGCGKEGNDVNYDLNKVQYSVEKIRQAQENNDEQE